MVAQTLLIYSFLTILLFLAARLSSERNTSFFIICAVLVYSAIFGLRSGVGMDFWSYKQWYDNALLGIRSYDHIEVGFRILMDTCASMHLPFSFFLGLIAFVQLLLVFLSVKQFKDTYPFLALVFMLGGIWLSYANGLRQQLAFCIFAYSVQFIACKDWIRYYICIFVAILFHTSAVLLVPVYPLYMLRNEWFKRKWLQLGLLAAVLVCSNSNMIDMIAAHVDSFAGYLGYDMYFGEGYSLTQTVRIGLGYWINLSVSISLILFSKDVKYFYGNRLVNIIYDLFYFGVIWRYLFISSQVFSRINYYFAGFEYIYAALTLAALWPERDMRKYILLSLYVIVFAAIMFRMHTNTALFMFNWQNILL